LRILTNSMTDAQVPGSKLVGRVPKDALPLAPAPELVFGLVGPIGVDLDLVTELLGEVLEDLRYSVTNLRITHLIREVPAGLPLDGCGYIDSVRTRIAYANKVRELLERNDAMAILAVSAIRQIRKAAEGDPEVPLENQAYIIRQFKRPEEIKLLRSVYGRQFI